MKYALVDKEGNFVAESNGRRVRGLHGSGVQYMDAAVNDMAKLKADGIFKLVEFDKPDQYQTSDGHAYVVDVPTGTVTKTYQPQDRPVEEVRAERIATIEAKAKNAAMDKLLDVFPGMKGQVASENAAINGADVDAIRNRPIPDF